MQELTLKEMLENHKKLWNWIADETEKRKRKVLKYEYFLNPYAKYPWNYFFACEYAYQIEESVVCGDGICKNICPLDWGKGVFGENYGCEEVSSPYSEWVGTENDDWKQAAKLARQIANIPLKPEYQKQLDGGNT